jgi:hypothetical protein
MGKSIGDQLNTLKEYTHKKKAEGVTLANSIETQLVSSQMADGGMKKIFTEIRK